MVTKRSNYISILLILIFLFFSYISSWIQWLLIFGILGCTFSLIRRCRNIKIYSSDLFVLGSSLVIVFTSVYAVNRNEALVLALVLCAFFIVRVFLHNQNGVFQDKVINLAYGISGIHVAATILQFFIPQLIIGIDQKILPLRTVNIILMWMQQKKYAGVSTQIGTNAFFISIFIGIAITKFAETKRKRNLFLILCGITSLILTGKRGAALSSVIVASVFILFQCENFFKNRQKKLFKGMIYLMIAIVGITGILFLNTLVLTNDATGLTSGRIDLYKYMFDNIKNHWIVGNGFGYIQEFLGMEGHNIYLQLLCEFGMFVIIFMLLFWSNLKESWLCLGKKEENLIKSTSLYIQLFFLLYGMVGNPIFDYFQFGLYLLLSTLNKGAETDRN